MILYRQIVVFECCRYAMTIGKKRYFYEQYFKTRYRVSAVPKMRRRNPASLYIWEIGGRTRARS